MWLKYFINEIENNNNITNYNYEGDELTTFNFTYKNRNYTSQIDIYSYSFLNYILKNSIILDILDLCGCSTNLGYIKYNKKINIIYWFSDYNVLYDLLVYIKPLTKYISIKSNAIRITTNTIAPIFIQLKYGDNQNEQIAYIYDLFKQLKQVEFFNKLGGCE